MYEVQGITLLNNMTLWVDEEGTALLVYARGGDLINYIVGATGTVDRGYYENAVLVDLLRRGRFICNVGDACATLLYGGSTSIPMPRAYASVPTSASY